MTYRKKLIKVALPLDAINRESAREKHPSTRNHPRGIHLWWARRPLATCRAVIFASLVDDPEQEGVPKELLDAIDALPTPPEGAADAAGSLRRTKLFQLIEELVKWENTTNEPLLETARKIIRAATGGNPPPLLDPFCGGGSIPLEGQRLGLEAYASDLNPVAVLITKALIEIPTKFAGKPPVNPESRNGTGGSAVWKGASGLAADVRYYGKWMRDEAWKRIGHLYPKGPKGETIIAWLWARTVKCPNPACGGEMPLMRSFWLSTKSSREVWLEPIVDKLGKTVHFEVRRGEGKVHQGTVNRAVGQCLVCGSLAPAPYVRGEADAHRMGATLEAVVTTGARGSGRGYRSPGESDIASLSSAAQYLENLERNYAGPYSLVPDEPCRGTFASNAQGGTYGFFRFRDYFNSRQLGTFATYHNLVSEVRSQVLKASAGDSSYADAVATYIGLALSRLLDFGSTLCWWRSDSQTTRGLFTRQAIPMTWDYVEVNLFGPLVSFETAVNWVADSMTALPTNAGLGKSAQLDATQTLMNVEAPIVVTDPPYYDNMSYGDLSDFFYVWLRRSVGKLHPELFSTVLTPKQSELVAASHRFAGDKKKAEKHFEIGLGETFALIRGRTHPDYPLTLYYAFKQEEEGESGGVRGLPVSTGWETMLKGLLDTGFQITGTWPMRTEQQQRAVAADANALASSIVLACRPRPEDAPIATRREFVSTLRRELPKELKVLMGGHVAPVDLAQAAIGPGMAVFSRYSKVLEADGSQMTVRTALQEINYVVEDVLAQQEGDLDVESQFCVAWFSEYGSSAGEYGRAETLATAKNLAVDGLARMELLDSARGKVRLTLREGYEDGRDPREQARLTAWEACQRLVWTLNERGEQEAGRLSRRLGGLAEQAKDLAYRLYGICDHKKWTEEALGYNALVASWPEIQKHAVEAAGETQGRMV